MKRLFMTIAAVMMAVTAVFAQGYGIKFDELEVTPENASDIFGDGLASYNPETNLLTLQDGFDYHLSKNFVVIGTGRDFGIRLEGNAEFYASVDCWDNLYIEADEAYTLKMTANISGSALKCPNLTVNENVTLDLLSRNSSSALHALDCAGELTVNKAVLLAEVTTARMAVAAQQMTLNGCWLKKPRGGGINPNEGGICYADGLPANQVQILVEGFGIEENEGSNDGEGVIKVFEDGQIFIIREGKRYNVMGQEIR